MESIQICNYLEKLRYKRNITQEVFLHNIVSIRQYKRYRKGECDVPIDVLEKLSNRLELSLMKLLIDFEFEKREEINQINELYNATVNRDFASAKSKIKKMKIKYVLDSDNKLYLSHSIDLYNFFTNKINQFELIDNTVKLLDYPLILQKKVLSDIEILVLSSLIEIKKFDEKIVVIKRLLSFLNDVKNIVSGNNKNIKMTILVRLARYYGTNGLYDDVIRICNLGIKMSKGNRSYYLLDYCYYFLALSYYKLEKIEAYLDNLYQCYNVIHLENNEAKTKKFESLFKKDFNVTYKDFINTYVKNGDRYAL